MSTTIGSTPRLACLSRRHHSGLSTGHVQSRGRRWRLSRATEEGSSATVRTIPIFPLSVVALPGCITPLYIFEARYRVLFNTLLAGEPNLEEELIQQDSPFKGSREFGLCYVGKEGMAKVGTMLYIEEHKRQPDGQLVVINKGRKRFTVTQVKEMKPVMICEVEELPDIEEEVAQEVDLSSLSDRSVIRFVSKELVELSKEVSELYRNVVKLTRKVNDNELEEFTEPVELLTQDPFQLSFWFASLFVQSEFEQQKILEERSCRARLLREKKIFDDALKYLSAASALKGAFPSDI